MARKNQEIKDIMTTEAEEQDLLGKDEVSEQDRNKTPNVLKNLSKILTDMSSGRNIGPSNQKTTKIQGTKGRW